MIKYYWKELYGGGEALHVELTINYKSIYLEFMPGVYKVGGNPKAYYVSAGCRSLRFKQGDQWVFTDSSTIPKLLKQYLPKLIEEAKKILVRNGISLSSLEPLYDDAELHEIVKALMS